MVTYNATHFNYYVPTYFVSVLFPSSKSLDQAYGQHSSNEPNFGFVYISHPRAVTQLSWRKTSKYMPK